MGKRHAQETGDTRFFLITVGEHRLPQTCTRTFKIISVKPARCCAPTPLSIPVSRRSATTLTARITEAEAARWISEAEGLKVSLAGARDKLAQMDQITARRSTAISLGMPGFAGAASRTVTTPANHNS